LANIARAKAIIMTGAVIPIGIASKLKQAPDPNSLEAGIQAIQEAKSVGPHVHPIPEQV
jgi:hypothetical protein